MPLHDSLVESWGLQEASGTRAGRPNGKTLTDNNTVTQTTGPGTIAQAALFTLANSESLSRPDEAALSLTGDWSISLWVKLTTRPATVMRLVSKLNLAGTDSPYELLWDNTDRFTARVIIGGVATSAIASTFGGTATATWYFIFASFTASDKKVRISVNNGVQDVSTAAASAPTDTDGPLYLGALGSLSLHYLDGAMAAVALWSRVLTAAEITSLYNGGNGRLYPFPADMSRSGSMTATFARKGNPFTRTAPRVGTHAYAFARLGTFKRTLTRSGTFLGAFVRHTIFARTLARVGTHAYTFARIGTFKRTVARVGTHAYTFARVQNHMRTLTRTSSVLAVFKRRGFPFKRTSSRSGAMTLTFVRGKVLIRSISRAGAMTLAFSVGHIYIRTLSRAGAMTLAFARAATFKRIAARAGAMTLAFFGRGSFNRTSARTGAMTLAFARKGNPFARTIARAGVVAAAFARKGNPFKRTIARTGAQTLTFARIIATTRTSSRSGAMTLVFSRAGSTYRRTLARAGAMTAAFARALTAKRSLTRAGSMTLVFARNRIFNRAIVRTGSMTLGFARKGNPFKRSFSRAGAMNMTATATRAVNLFKTLARAGAMTLRFLFQVGRPRPRGIILEGELQQHIFAAEDVTPTLEATTRAPLLLGAEMETES